MAENPFGQGGPEEEELSIEGNPIDTAEIDPQLAEAIASGEMTEMEDGSVEVGEFVEETEMPGEEIPFDAKCSTNCFRNPLCLKLSIILFLYQSLNCIFEVNY